MPPPRFDCLQYFPQPFAEGAPELDWLDQALDGSPVAAFWQSAAALVAPASYRNFPALAAAAQAPAAGAWPVRVRRSGGGVVPQGPGIANLSLAYQPGGGVGEHGDAVYLHLCQLLSAALATVGVSTFPTSVPGSFCDGRYNLAAGTRASPRKLAGTAQYWRTRHGRQAVLAHAVVLLDCDPQAVTAQVNGLEARLETGRQFDAASLSTVADEAAASGSAAGHPAPASLPTALAQALAVSLAAPLHWC